MSKRVFDNTDLSKAMWVFYVFDSSQPHVPKHTIIPNTCLSKYRINCAYFSLLRLLWDYALIFLQDTLFSRDNILSPVFSVVSQTKGVIVIPLIWSLY